MNIPSLLKFEPIVRRDGYLFMNSSVIDREPKRQDIKTIKVPANEIADQLGNLRVANMVMLGAFVFTTKCVNIESLIDAMKYKLKGKDSSIIELNVEAIKQGLRHVGG